MSNTGKVQSIAYELTYADYGSQQTADVEIGVLPPNAIPVNIYVDVKTAFNSTTSDTLTLGTSDDTNRFEASIDLQSTGRASLTLLTMGEVVSATANTTIVAAIAAGSATIATAGSARVVLEYVQL